MNTFDKPGVPLRSVLALAARGWRVFPCIPGGKRPALRGNWQDHATADPDRIRAWWGRAPYNIGIACGPSGLVVIDLDVPSAKPGEATGAQAASGADSLAALCARHRQPCPLPTHAVATPSGGCHLYYTAPATPIRNSAGRLGLHIDIRADGGYVIGAGSRSGDHAYAASDQRPPVPLPGWIADLLDSKPPLAGPTQAPRGEHGTAYAMAALREETRLVATARPGTRNETLNRAAFSLGQLTQTGLLPPLAVITALASAAERAGLPTQEAIRTIRSGMTASARNPRNNQADLPSRTQTTRPATAATAANE